MASDRQQGALVAAALAYSLDVGDPDRRETAHRVLLDAASDYRRSTVGDDGRPVCEFCGTELTSAHGWYRKAEGWAEVRRQGGTHALVGQRFTGDVACGSCITALRRGVQVEQGSLLS